MNQTSTVAPVKPIRIVLQHGLASKIAVSGFFLGAIGSLIACLFVAIPRIFERQGAPSFSEILILFELEALVILATGLFISIVLGRTTLTAEAVEGGRPLRRRRVLRSQIVGYRKRVRNGVLLSVSLETTNPRARRLHIYPYSDDTFAGWLDGLTDLSESLVVEPTPSRPAWSAGVAQGKAISPPNVLSLAANSLIALMSVVLLPLAFWPPSANAAISDLATRETIVSGLTVLAGLAAWIGGSSQAVSSLRCVLAVIVVQQAAPPAISHIDVLLDRRPAIPFPARVQFVRALMLDDGRLVGLYRQGILRHGLLLKLPKNDNRAVRALGVLCVRVHSGALGVSWAEPCFPDR